MEQTDFDQAIVSQPNGAPQTMTRDEYYRQPLRVRVDQLIKGQVRFLAQGQPVSPLKIVRGNQ